MEFLNGIPYRRAAQTLEAPFGVLLSVGTLEAAQTRIAERLKNAANCIYELLRRPNVLCADETGARAAGKNYWVHVLCNGKAAHYVLREKRGKEGCKTA
jgi:hypothetical protein